MRRLLTLFALVLAIPLMGAAASPALRYSLSPVFEGRALKAIAVELSFAGDADGETALRLPGEWGGSGELWKHITALKVDGGKMREAGPSGRVISHQPGVPLTVRYRLVNGYDGDPAPGMGNPYRPVVRPTWFQLIGDATFIEVEGRQDVPVQVHWANWPKAWWHASDLDHADMGRTLRMHDVVDSVSIGGTAMKIHEREIEGGRLRFAVLGEWDFKTSGFADELASVLSAQRRFWGDANGPFFVSLTPIAAAGDWRSAGGTGRGDGFALFSTRNATGGLRYLVAHEHIHSWVPAGLGRMPPVEQTDYWFSEGFTDFYALRTLLYSGSWSLEEYAAKLNEELAAHDVSPARNWSNSRLAEVFWTDKVAQRLPYRRGMLLAYRWDQMIRVRTGGAKDLDDVMLAMRDRAQGPGQKPLVREAFRLAMRDVADIDIAADLTALVENGEAFELPDRLFGDCAQVTRETRGVFERGWEPKDVGGGRYVVEKVKVGSNAWKAGIRDGMSLLGKSGGVTGDERYDYVIGVKDAAGERKITYRPVGEGTYILRQVVLTAGMDGTARETCRKRMSGGI
jgi:predicted metalloprotease with PDZ domain